MSRTPVTRRAAEFAGRFVRAAGSVIDEMVYAVAPGAGSRRVLARKSRELAEQRIAKLASHWDGADDDRIHGADRWMRSRLSPDSALEQDLTDLRERSDELYRGDPYIHGAIEHRTTNVVGRGWRFQSRIEAYPGLVTDAQAKEYRSELEWVYRHWKRRAGFRGSRSLRQVAKLAQRYYRRHGETFVILSDVATKDAPIPLDVSIVAPERCETPPGEEGNPLVRLGIERDARGNIVAYHFRRSHPYDTKDVQMTYDRIPARRVRHVFDQMWAGQSRGIPWAQAVTTSVKDRRDYQEATIIAAQVAACATLIIGTSNPLAAARGAATETNSSGQRLEDLQPGKVLYTDNPDNIQGFSPTQPTTTYPAFLESILLSHAAGLNYPFGWLVRDRRKASYSAGKLEEIEGGMEIAGDQMDHDETWLHDVGELLIRESVILGETSIDMTAYSAESWAFNEHVWLPTPRPWLDPPREISAFAEAKNENMETLANIAARQSMDVEELLKQRQFERDMEREFDIEPPSMKSKVAPSGATAADAAEATDTAEAEEEADAEAT